MLVCGWGCEEERRGVYEHEMREAVCGYIENET